MAGTLRGYTSTDERARGDRFLAAYHQIEQALRKMSGGPDTRDSFRHLVDDMAKENAAIRRFRDDLAEFGELRNAIVHERVSPDFLIAVPLEETVLQIEEIARLVTDPPVVYPMFKRDVQAFSPHDSMGDVFRVMRLTGFTQFPVYEDEVYLGLLTDGGIAAWVAQALTPRNLRSAAPRPVSETTGAASDSSAEARQSSGQSLAQTPVKEVLAGQKNPDRARFVSRTATIYEVEELFRENPQRDRRPVSAVLITQSGKSQDKLLGIVTPSDILSFRE